MKRPELVFSLSCLNVTMEDDKPIFHMVFFELPFVSMPLSFFVCNGWVGAKGEYCQEIRILKPDRKESLVKTKHQHFQIEDEVTPQFIMNFFEGIVFPEPGIYWVQTYLDHELVKEFPLPVREV